MERRALVAHVERTTGFDVASVEEVEIAPLANGKCHCCGVAIRFVFVSWCDDCMDAAVKWNGSNVDYCRAVWGHIH